MSSSTGISIIVPVYNSESFLEQCIRSVLNQDFESFELLLVDDGSTDQSLSICDRWSDAEQRIKVIHKSNGGVSSARNVGLDLAEGKYVMFLDSDDRLEPGALDRLWTGSFDSDLVLGGYNAYEDGKLKFTMCPDTSWVYKDEGISEFWDVNLARTRRCLDSPWCKLFKRSLIVEMKHRFDEGLYYAEDKMFVYSFILACSSISVLKEPVYIYELRSGSLGSDRKSDKHLLQLRHLIPVYAQLLEELCIKYPDSYMLAKQYRDDLIGTYVCRALNVFASRKTEMLSMEYLEFLYEIMSKDKHLSIFSIRLGQVGNILLFMIGSPRLSLKVYGLTSRFLSICTR